MKTSLKIKDLAIDHYATERGSVSERDNIGTKPNLDNYRTGPGSSIERGYIGTKPNLDNYRT